MNKKKLFIGNLHYSVTEDQLQALFTQHGDLISVKVMPGKGYGFIEMGTPEQAHMIKDTMSESVFQGRRLLIDYVPDKKSEPRKWASISTEPRRTGRKPDQGTYSRQRVSRPEVADQTAERVHHLTDVTEEFKKSPKPEMKSEKPAPRIGQYAAPVSTQKTTKPEPSRRVPEKEGARRPAKPGVDQSKGTKSPSPDYGKQQAHPGNKGENDRKSREIKPKKIKEKPPKNPHPYQGSKKSKSSPKPDPHSKQEPKETEDDEKMSYLRHMASRAGKK